MRRTARLASEKLNLAWGSTVCRKWRRAHLDGAAQGTAGGAGQGWGSVSCRCHDLLPSEACVGLLQVTGCHQS